MNAYVFLNLSNELRKKDIMQDLQSILSPLRNAFDKFSSTGTVFF